MSCFCFFFCCRSAANCSFSRRILISAEEGSCATFRSNSLTETLGNLSRTREKGHVPAKACTLAAGLRLRGREAEGRLQERLHERLLAAAKRLQQPCWRLQNG